MFLLGNDGRIIGRDPAPEAKPAPFVSDTAKWIGSSWEYSDPPCEMPSIDKSFFLTAFHLQCHIVDLISPEPGSFSKPKSKDVTVLIPAYGKKKYIKDAIGSCLAQTYKPYEVVVLDMDNETEGLDIPASVRVVPHERLNASDARNLLVKLCETEQFIFLDADDMLSENYIEEVLKPEANIVSTSVVHMEDNGSLHEDWAFVGWEERPFTIVNYNLTGLLCKEAFNDIGGLDEELANGGEDSDFNTRIFEHGKWKVAFTTKARLKYRINVGGLSTKESFLKSKEIELHKHAKSLIKWLESSYEPRSSAKEWALKWRPPAIEILKGFEAMWPYRTSDVMLVPVELKDIRQFEEYGRLYQWSKVASKLIDESSKRPTSNVCNLDSPRWFGRAVDLIVGSDPSEMVDPGKVVYNSGVDLSKPSLEIMAHFNVIWTGRLSNVLKGFDFRGHSDERMFGGREGALF